MPNTPPPAAAVNNTPPDLRSDDTEVTMLADEAALYRHLIATSSDLVTGRRDPAYAAHVGGLALLESEHENAVRLIRDYYSQFEVSNAI